MEITYGGGASFLLRDEDRTISINPERRTDKADVSLYSGRKTLKGLIVDGPGEYEIGGVLVTSVRLAGTLAHAVGMGGMNVVFLDAVPTEPQASDTESLGRPDVLVVRTDDLRAAQAVTRELLPRVVIPFGSHATEACTALGVTEAKPQLRWAWSGNGTPPKAVLLKAPSAKKRNVA